MDKSKENDPERYFQDEDYERFMGNSEFEKALRTQGENNWQRRLGHDPIFHARLEPFYSCPECESTCFYRDEEEGKDGLEIIYHCKKCGWAIDSISGKVYS